MRTFHSILNDFKIFFSPRTRRGQIHIGILVAVIAAAAVVFLRADDAIEGTPSLRTVSVASIASLQGGSTLEILGTVSSSNGADIRAEVAGRVTSVPVSLGQKISAGTVIATLENASQYAALLQAEGAYEAAQANAQAGNVSVSQAQSGLSAAQNAAVSAERAAYTTISNAFYSTIDQLYGNPDFSTPGVRVSSSESTYLNTERVAFQTILTDWQRSSAALTTASDLDASLTNAQQNVSRTIAVVDAFIRALNDADDVTISGATPESYVQSFNTLRTTLNNTLASLEGAEVGLKNARETLSRAEIGGTGGEVSVANAQVKQALGSLKAAQASYNKTILRSPIAGTVSELMINSGDYVGGAQSVAKISNDGAYEITAFVNENDAELLTVGTEVQLGANAKGTIAHIAPGVSQSTGKVEVKINSTDNTLTTGTSIAVIVNAATTTPETQTTLFVPITAVKFHGAQGSVFTVSDTLTLEAHEVTLGRITGGMVEIVEGAAQDMRIVVDARGLAAGETVIVSE